ncbi:serine/threonine protein kinase [Candidatus Uabimicrobium amorphum]|uniref:non-specific serine/threonine protein kinase n=2 Tax=Uabimicrobium amorphum TaxID=2596890 RepID=A0A5S9F2S7_UABAM|nr:serine/threonine protein kinase [Candidatus Uabimicrobium amorphum]
MGVNMENKVVAKFTVFVNKKMISSFHLMENTSIVIGRGNEATYQIKSSALSRRHCQILSTPQGVFVNDCGSLNGTYVNYAQIKKPTPLQTNDQIQLGPITFRVETFVKYHTTQHQHHQHVVKAPTIPPTSLSANALVPIADDEARPTQHMQDFSPLTPVIPSGKCLACQSEVSAKDIRSQMGVFKGNEIYCINCFSKGAGNFPTIAGFRIVKKLGSGGMGDVYEAIQLSMQRPVAFKLMRGLENASEQQVLRFFREARTGGKLHHPNIVSFIDAGKMEKACYIAMELVSGTNVRSVLEARGPIDYREVMRIAYYVGKALDYAYSKFTVVHRDVKPENILIDTDNVVKLTDFGLAKNLEEAGLSGITKSQTGVGTLFYMSPEQIADARFADQRADVYSLGISMYEMITNEKPFFATQMMPLVNKIRYSEPRPIQEIIPDVPDNVCNIIAKSMSKEPDDRYQTSGEMIKVIKQYVQEEL